MDRFETARHAVLAALLASSVGACERHPGTTPIERDAATVATATPPEPAVVASEAPVMATAGVQPDTSAFDAKAFAGTFTGTLPCADCPGIDEQLVLAADGTFELTDTYRERPGSRQSLQGTWAVESDGRSLRLDPGSKTAQDRLFALDGNDALVPLGADGRPTGAPGDPRLHRSR
jgi:copper homeostasis protein (lipoprotein)